MVAASHFSYRGVGYGPRDPVVVILSVEKILVLFAATIALLMTTHSLTQLFSQSVAEGMIERSTNRGSVIYLGLYALQGGIFGLLLMLRILSGRFTIPMVAALLVCGYVLSSSLWSDGQNVTLFNASILSLQIMTAFALAAYVPMRQFLRLFFFVCCAIVLASFALLILAPHLAGNARYGGGWLTDIEFSGVMSSKNHAGYVFSSAAILALHGSLIGIRPLLRWSVGLLAAVAVVLSNSATALLALVVIGSATVAFRLLGPKRSAILFALELLLIAGMFLVPFIEPGSFSGILDRDSTFTGRTDLWAVAFEAFADKPIFGHGYYGFFDDGAYSPVWRLWERFLYFFTDSFHNSAVDTAVSLGLVGITLLATLCVTASLVIFRETIDEGSRLLGMSLLAIYTIGSTMELAFLHHNHVATIILFYLVFVVMGEGNPVPVRYRSKLTIEADRVRSEHSARRNAAHLG